MEPAAQVPVSPAPRKKSALAIVALAAAILAVLLALAAGGAAVYLFIENGSLRSSLSSLESDMDELASDSADDVGKLQKSLDDLNGTELAAIKADVAVLKEANSAPAPVFTLASFKLDFDDGTYTDSYDGAGELSCNDKSPYLALLKQTLRSGGTYDAKKESYYFVSVTDGTGTFSTYDWGMSGDLQRPDYMFEVVGYIRVDEVPAK